MQSCKFMLTCYRKVAHLALSFLVVKQYPKQRRKDKQFQNSESIKNNAWKATTTFLPITPGLKTSVFLLCPLYSAICQMIKVLYLWCCLLLCPLLYIQLLSNSNHSRFTLIFLKYITSLFKIYNGSSLLSCIFKHFFFSVFTKKQRKIKTEVNAPTLEIL